MKVTVFSGYSDKGDEYFRFCKILKKDRNDVCAFKNLREVNTVGTLTFKLLSGSFFLGVLSAFFFLVDNKTKITFSAWNGDGQTPRGGGSLSWQPAGFEKADQACLSFVFLF